MHAGGDAATAPVREHAAETEQTGEPAARRVGQRLGQPGGKRGHVQRTPHRAQKTVAVQGEALRRAGNWVIDADLARQARQQFLPVPPEVLEPAGTARRALAVLQHRVECHLRVDAGALGKHHVRRHHPVEHSASNPLGKLSSVLQRHTRAVRGADQVDALGAQTLAHRVEIACGQRGREEAQVIGRLERCRRREPRQTVSKPLQLRVGRGEVSERFVLGLITAQRRRPAGAALIDKDDIAPVVESRQQGKHPGGDIDRALPRATGQQKHRIWRTSTGHGGRPGVVDVDRRAIGPRRIERAPHAPAAQFDGDAPHPAR